MWLKMMICSLAILLTSKVFAASEIMFRCDTTPKGLIEVSRDKTTYKFNISKNGKNILNYTKDFKKNTEKSFLRFNYSYDSNSVAIGFLFGYFGAKRNEVHSVYMDEFTTHSVGYDVNNNKILECVKNKNYINRLRELDRQKGLPAFSYD
ncbi:hypothetical protein [Acinetobacter haemolyticus]|uniref:hypothetical protein n=1 Tax=Acinetobacter haemolyticus TaxID=29430 RepID=UPI001372AA28|nr:hypothetical protein [Acinetobacter haemolyticus]NAR99892.1 hypothetical protein [Acinetobacter haemolyticus]